MKKVITIIIEDDGTLIDYRWRADNVKNADEAAKKMRHLWNDPDYCTEDDNMSIEDAQDVASVFGWCKEDADEWIGRMTGEDDE